MKQRISLKLKNLLHTYVCVMSSVVLATALFITIFMPQSELGVELLWQMMLVSFLCSAGVLMYPEKAISRKRLAALVALHYVEVNAAVLGFGFYFKWFSIKYLPHVISMLVLINVIFLIVSMVEWKRSKKIAGQMNRRLAEYQKSVVQ